jgi:hypothetical protein
MNTDNYECLGSDRIWEEALLGRRCIPLVKYTGEWNRTWLGSGTGEVEREREKAPVG